MNIEQYNEQIGKHNLFFRLLGGRLTFMEDGHAEAEMPTGRDHANPNNTVHGGVLMTLADVTSGAAARSTGHGCTTLECKMNFLRPAKVGTTLFSVAETLHMGRRTGVYDCRIYDEDRKLIAVSTVTMFLFESQDEARREGERITGTQA